jgi:hypothetical protein
MLRSLALALLVGAVPLAAHAQGAASPPRTCDTDSTYHKLDFWLGDWRVTVNGVLDGTDRIEKVLGGCAIIESWHDADGHLGQSLFFVSPVMRRWKQVWITDQAQATGGTKEKSAIGWYPDGGVRFQGELIGALGRIVLDRTTLTPMPDGTVRQVIEHSLDGGSTWQPPYVATYTRAKS